MKIERRSFLKLGAALTISQMTGAQTTEALKRKGLSILQGATDDSRTQFSILHKTSDHFEIYLTDAYGTKINPDAVYPHSFPGQPKQITKAYFSNLDFKQFYHLNIFDPLAQTVVDKRQFKTLDPHQEILNFALCSCMDDGDHEPGIWRTLIHNKPDIIFFVGDSVYADAGAPKGGATPAHLWKRFCEAREKLEIFYSPSLVPILATWDDHDFGLNDSNSIDYKYVRQSQKNFLTFFAQDSDYCQFLQRGPGVSSAFTWKDQLFLLLDDRSFRLPRGSKDRFAHWGQEQEQWMMSMIKQNRGPVWFMNGTQIFPQMPFKESVSSDHPVQLEAVLSQIKSINSKVIFVSGDVHYSEISRIENQILGYETFELTSSSIHSQNMPGVPGIIPNRRRIASTGKRNYIFVKSKILDRGADFTATSFSQQRDVLFQRKLRV